MISAKIECVGVFGEYPHPTVPTGHSNFYPWTKGSFRGFQISPHALGHQRLSGSSSVRNVFLPRPFHVLERPRDHQGQSLHAKTAPPNQATSRTHDHHHQSRIQSSHAERCQRSAALRRNFQRWIITVRSWSTAPTDLKWVEPPPG